MDEMMRTLRKQNFWMRITALCMAGIFAVALLSAVILIPRATKVLENATQTLEEADVAVQELNKTATELAKVDIEGLVSDTQVLIDNSTNGISQALEKLNAVDIETLNNAISSLNSIVSPLSKLFGN